MQNTDAMRQDCQQLGHEIRLGGLTPRHREERSTDMLCVQSRSTSLELMLAFEVS